KVIHNILFYDELIPKLLNSTECVEVIIELMQSEDFTTSFYAVTILSFICAKIPDIWSQKMPRIPLQSILTQIKDIISKYKINQKLNIYWDTFKYTFQLLKLQSLPPELQYRFMWVLVYTTRADCAKYCPMIEKENGIEV